MRDLRTTDAGGRAVYAPPMPQRRGMALARRCLRVLGAPALRLLGGAVGALQALGGADEAQTTDVLVVAAALRDALPPAELDAAMDVLASDAVEALILDVLDGVTIDGAPISKADPDSLDRAYPDADPWAPYLTALWIATERRLFPLPGGSTSDTGRGRDPAASPRGPTTPSDGAQTPPN